MSGEFLIVANWKMNGHKADFERFCSVFMSSGAQKNVNVVVCPPFTAMPDVAPVGVSLGAQNCHHLDCGAFTGDISAPMLRTLGCGFVIVGHSERRIYYGETCTVIQQKAESVIKNSMIPILCIGESKEERMSGQASKVILNQLKSSAPRTGRYVIAYEPIWAIGSGVVPSNGDIEEVISIIREVSSADVLYGGSVNEVNAHHIASVNTLGGLLIGSASIAVESFIKIVDNVSNTLQHLRNACES